MMRTLLVAAVILCATVVSAMAFDRAAAQRDCTADAMRLCAPVISSGERAVTRCMIKNRRKLSSACAVHLKGRP